MPVISLLEVYAVVAAVKLALLSYKAILNWSLAAVKLCVAVISSFLNEVHKKFPENAIYIFLIYSANVG